MPDAAPSSTFLRFLREAMNDIGSDGARGFREGADEALMSPAGRGASMLGGLAGAGVGGYMGGAAGDWQDDPDSEALMGGVGGGLAGAAAGGVGAGLVGGGRGSARALRIALQRALREGGQRGGEAGVQPMRQPIALMRQLQQLQRMRAELPDDDPRAAQLDMAIAQLSQQLQQMS